MKSTILLLCSALLSSVPVTASQIDIPNTFRAGQQAVAAEVNENFSILQIESNAQDLRIARLEAVSPTLATVTDQLLCIARLTWLTSGESYDCVQNTDPANIRSLTYVQVIQEGWIATSIGGDDHNISVFIFSK